MKQSTDYSQEKKEPEQGGPDMKNQPSIIMEAIVINYHNH